jgi:adenylate cyclase
MNDASATEIGTWVTTTGLAGASELDLLRGFCERLAAAGFPLARATVLIDTLHPVHEGRAFRWRRDPTDEPEVLEYGRTHADSQYAEQWRSSPFHHLLAAGRSALRRSLARGDPADFPAVEELRAQGHIDYLALVHRFAANGVIGEMDCVYASWSTDAPSGFADEQVEALSRLVPSLALAVKCVAGADRGHAGGDLPRPRRRPAGPERADRPRRR